VALQHRQVDKRQNLCGQVLSPSSHPNTIRARSSLLA
jgi:hypothetical protein